MDAMKTWGSWNGLCDMSGLLENYASEYAPHICLLLNEMDQWILRRVVSISIYTEDTVQIEESIDFDLTVVPAGEEYLHFINGERRIGRELPLIIPIGLYPSPFVLWDLRDSGENRISLVTGPTRNKLKGETEEYAGNPIKHPPGDLVLAQVPREYGKERRIIHWRYLTELMIIAPYIYDPRGEGNRPENCRT